MSMMIPDYALVAEVMLFSEVRNWPVGCGLCGQAMDQVGSALAPAVVLFGKEYRSGEGVGGAQAMWWSRRGYFFPPSPLPLS
eukprot:350585-Chlamydomonas_euryale.AAC.1